MGPNNNEGAAQWNSSDIVAARLRINAAAEIRVLAQVFAGHRYVHVRQYILGDQDLFVPTAKGISLPIQSLPELLEAVGMLRNAENALGTVFVVKKNSREEIRFSITAWQGTTKADIRTYFAATEGERQPGKGVRFNLVLLAELERGLEALDRKLNG